MDNNVEVAKAKAWVAEVQAEFEAVHALLKQVAEECMQKPEEDDTILNAFAEAGQQLQDTWTLLNNVFDAAVDALLSIVGTVAKFVQEVVEAVSDYRSKIRN